MTDILHNPAPWSDQLTPLIEAYDERVKINGNPPRTALRLLSEHNFQFAMRCVNAHDDLVKALQEIEMICTESQSACRKRMGTRVGNSLMAARAALTKAGVK